MRSTEGLHLCGPRGNDEDPDPVCGGGVPHDRGGNRLGVRGRGGVRGHAEAWRVGGRVLEPWEAGETEAGSMDGAWDLNVTNLRRWKGMQVVASQML